MTIGLTGRMAGSGEFPRKRLLVIWGLVAANFALLAFVFRDSIAETVDTWLTSEEYNFGPIVPPLAALMIWRDLRRHLETSPVERRGGWLGVAIVFLGLLLCLLEYLSHTRFPGQLGTFVTAIGIIVAWQGESRARRFWPGLVFLMFGLPIATAIQVQLTAALQLVSSKGAVAVMQAMSITVLREGNMIDLGSIKLEVAEACSGLRYLFPLSTFAFLCAYLFVGRWWERGLILLSSIPITIAMNILRIGLTGALVNEYGPALAEGFFHSFEGWIVYCLCVSILFIEMKVLCLVDGRGRSLLRRLDLDLPKRAVSERPETPRPWIPSAAVMALFGGLLVVEVLIGSRADVALTRLHFTLYPRELGGWVGTEAPVDQESLRILNATDYLSVNYTKGDQGFVNTWIAYYDEQFSGQAAHSPEVCIPGGGWSIESIETRSLPIAAGNKSEVLPIKRLIIRQGQSRSLVYYWFLEGGEPIADETWAKLRLLANAVVHNRRDGALVRFVTPIDGPSADAQQAADARLTEFISNAVPALPPYLP